MHPSALERSVADLKLALARHPIYTQVNSLPRLRVLVEHHVACVWDFMSLLKSLQKDLAGVGLPWQPPQDAMAARLINEIVLDEESDGLPYRDGHASHFVWYVEAMEELGANTRPVTDFLAMLTSGTPALDAMRAAHLPDAAREFTAVTLSFLDEPLPVRAAVFLHGREDLIPRMFHPLATSLRHQGLPCSRFLAYLQRHIEIDGGAHGAHASALLQRLCDGNPELQPRCTAAASRSLEARLRLWDAIVAAI